MLAVTTTGGKKGRRRRIDPERVRQLRDEFDMTFDAVAKSVKCSTSYARLVYYGRTDDTDGLSRLSKGAGIDTKIARLPPVNSPAVMEGRTLYPSTVADPGPELAVLKSGYNSAKIGRRITKGKWAEMEVYTLTLEERATCPRDCRHWRSCYGNHMQHAVRFRHGDALERAIADDIARLQKRHRDTGFAVRLHTLGDFYSVRYVRLWGVLLDMCPQLHCFGFTARWDYRGDPIAHALVDMVRERWDRFAIRFSNAPIDECATVSIEHPYGKPSDAIICPQQLGKTQTCGTCALCWQSKRRIAFIQH